MGPGLLSAVTFLPALGAAGLISLGLWRRWVVRGRPAGVARAAR